MGKERGSSGQIRPRLGEGSEGGEADELRPAPSLPRGRWSEGPQEAL